MATIRQFEDINAWQKSRLLVRKIYEVSKSEGFRKDFGLKDQMRRAGVSIMSNIAEGFGRNSGNAFANYLNIARGSAAETQSLLYVALDQEYIDADSFDTMYGTCAEISRMTVSFSNYLRKK